MVTIIFFQVHTVGSKSPDTKQRVAGQSTHCKANPTQHLLVCSQKQNALSYNGQGQVAQFGVTVPL